ncbi:MAG: TonB-dependent receptor [Janthinobacterium lividum]
MSSMRKTGADRFLVLMMLSSPTLCSRAMAQAVFGTIYGTVTDASGAAVPNAKVIVTDVAKGTNVTLQSNGSGEFTNDHLIPDTYSVKVESHGFKAYEQTDIRVFADTSFKVTAALQVGDAGQTVEVNANQVPLLKTDRADVATEFSSQEIVDLPIPDRNFTNLQLLLPGAQLLGWSHAADEDPQGSKQIEIDGQSFAGVAYQLDGTDNEDPILGIIVINPNADSLSETKIATQNYDAEFGKAVSAVVTAQTKSGTNALHGSAFDYRESNANLARDPFTQGPNQLSATNPFPAGLRNQFGGSIGGPILKNKAFFFGDYQGTRQKVGIAAVQTVPSAHLISTCLGQSVAANGVRGCDFSEYATAIGQQLGLTGQALANYNLLYQPGTSTPFTGNVIPTAQLSQQSLGLLKLLQPYAPNTAGALNGLKNNYAGSGTGGFNGDQWDVRGDYTVSATTHAFGRFSRFTDVLTGNTLFGQAGGAGFGLGGYGGSSKGANDSSALGIDIAISPKLVTDIRLGYLRYGIDTAKYDQNVPLATQLGIAGLNTGNSFTGGAPGFDLSEVGSFGAPSNGTAVGPQYGAGLNIDRCNCPLSEHEDQFQIANNWTKIISNHEVKFGADLRYARNLRVPSDNNRAGLLNFGTGPTGGGSTIDPTTGTAFGTHSGLGFATFLVGDVTELQRYVSTSTNAKEFQKRDYFYVQDTWRATPKLTVNYGLRYEVYFPESVNGPALGSLLNLDTGYLQVAGVGGIRSDMDQQRPNNTYAPRIGVAYQVTPTTVIRSGYGRSFDIGVFGSIFGHAATQNLPVLENQAVTATNGDNATDNAFAFNLAQGAPAATFPTVPGDGLLPNPGNLETARSRPTTLRLPTLDAWNLSLQQSITPTLSMTFAYVGNKGTHTFGDVSGNTVNPNEAAIDLPGNYSVTGNGLHYDPSVSATTTAGGATGVAANGGTANQTLLQRYYGGRLAACADPNYTAVGGVRAPNGGCGWNQSITDFADNLDTHYNALQVSLAKTLAHGYSLNANYSWQQATAEGTSYSTWSHRAVYGRAGDLRPQVFIAYGLFQLPFGHNKPFLSHVNGFVNQIVSGFEINPVVNWSSGLPFTLCASSYTSWVPSDAPCYVNGDNYAFHKNVTGIPGNSLYFYQPTPLGTGGFTAPSLDQIGNVGRNSVLGPHFFNTDLSIQKNFPIRERVTLQLRADGYNAFNHINWGTPQGGGTNYIDQGGQISSGPYPNSSANPRQLQFSGRVQF